MSSRQLNWSSDCNVEFLFRAVFVFFWLSLFAAPQSGGNKRQSGRRVKISRAPSPTEESAESASSQSESDDRDEEGSSAESEPQPNKRSRYARARAWAASPTPSSQEVIEVDESSQSVSGGDVFSQPLSQASASSKTDLSERDKGSSGEGRKKAISSQSQNNRGGLLNEMPLSMSSNISRTTMLLQTEDDSIDLLGDTGTVGRIRYSEPPAPSSSEKDEEKSHPFAINAGKGSKKAKPSEAASGTSSEKRLMFDIKGRLFEGHISPTVSIAVVSLPSKTTETELAEAKVRSALRFSCFPRFPHRRFPILYSLLCLVLPFSLVLHLFSLSVVLLTFSLFSLSSSSSFSPRLKPSSQTW